jgi:hypothetical protein
VRKLRILSILLVCLLTLGLVFVSCDDLGSDIFTPPNDGDNRPTLTGTVTIDKTSPQLSDILTATYSPGNGSGNPTWQWLRDDAPITGATNASYTVDNADVGAKLKAQVRFADQKDSVTSAATAAVTSSFVPVTSITGIQTSGSPGTLTLAGTVNPANATNKTIMWSVQSAGTTGASVNGNTLTTTAVGTATVRATITNGTAVGTDYTQDFPISIGNLTDLGNGLYLLENADYRDFAIEARLDATQWTNVTSKSGYSQVLRQISSNVYAKFNDDFDFIFFVLNSSDKNTMVNALGFYGVNVRVSNSVKGLGLSVGSSASSYGSAGELKSLMYFPYDEAIKWGPSLHEVAHNWAANIFPTYYLDNTRCYSHWGVSNAGGQLGGFKHIREVSTSDGVTEYQASMYPATNSDGSFKNGGFGEYANGGNGIPYSDIELYLIGMIGADELPKDFSLDIYTGLSYDENTVDDGYFKATGFDSYTIDQIISEKGARVPNAKDSQKSFKVLTIILSDSRDTAASTRYDEIVGGVKWFAGDTEIRGLYNFKQATRNIGSLEVNGIINSLK